MSGITVNLGAVGLNKISLGFFVKVANLPTGDMILCDLFLGVTGYFRVKLTPAGRIYAEGNYAGVTVSGGPPYSLNITPSAAIVTGIWYWVASYFGSVNDTFQYP